MSHAEVDCHVHSIYSDGAMSPTELAIAAKNDGLKAVCLTDHDNFKGCNEFLTTAQSLGLDALSGIEITSNYRDTDIHILGYGFRLDEEVLSAALQSTWLMREARSKRVLALYAEHGVMDVTYEQVRKASRCLAPYFPNTWLWDYRTRNYDVTLEQAMSEVARGGFARLPYNRSMLMTPVEAVRLINSLGGVAVLAHPGELKKRTDGDPDLADQILRELLELLVPFGLFGMEAIYFKHSVAETMWFSDIARAYGLFITAGSDYHGRFFPYRPLGMPGMSYEQFLQMKSTVNGGTQ